MTQAAARPPASGSSLAAAASPLSRSFHSMATAATTSPSLAPPTSTPRLPPPPAAVASLPPLVLPRRRARMRRRRCPSGSESTYPSTPASSSSTSPSSPTIPPTVFSLGQDRRYWRQKMEGTPGSLAPSLLLRMRISTIVAHFRCRRLLGKNTIERPTSWEHEQFQVALAVRVTILGLSTR